MSPDEYMTALALASARIIDAVHARKDPTALIRAAMTLQPPEGMVRTDALCIVLAAQADPIASLQQRIGWVRSLDPHLRDAS